MNLSSINRNLKMFNNVLNRKNKRITNIESKLKSGNKIKFKNK